MATLIDFIKNRDIKGAKRKLEVIRRNTYAKGFMAGLIHFIKPGDICIDCGANVGVFTKQFAEKGATVIAYEPDDIARAELINNVACLSNVEIIPGAVGAKDGTATLFRQKNFENDPIANTVASTIIPGMRGRSEEAGSKIEVHSLPEKISSILQKHDRIRLLKLDIEGSEVEVVEALLAQNLFDKIDITIVETHESQRPDAAAKYAAFRKAAEENPQWGLFLDWV